MKITPAHDFNDFEVGRRHNLPLVNVFDEEARLSLKGNDDFLRDAHPDAALMALDGVAATKARKTIVDMLEAQGLIDKIEPTVHAVPHGDRSGAVIEPFLTDQWYVDAKTLAQPAIEAVRHARTKFVPSQWEATFFNWMENIQPWCISRQIWWGHQIPAWYGPDGKVFVAETEDDAVADALAHYSRHRGDHCPRGSRHRRGPRAPPGFRQRLFAPRRGRARHLVLLGAVAVLDTWLA